MPGFDPATLRYDDRGLLPAVAQDAGTGEVLMLAWMNAEAVAETLATGRVTYWSRSRAALWRKGETSGHIQRLVDMRLDCDRDTILVLVDQTGPACHTNRRTCFFTAVRGGAEVELMKPEAGPASA
ncbi:MAG: phosphoribosyl-AMP cyclohydrolase [Pseudomonadota bacterium]